ncbi:MAG: hypothetical protein L3J59_13615 [Methylococcaceae bacterium]|nr:hypothetical protein [Methylococcaceae bacterium]
MDKEDMHFVQLDSTVFRFGDAESGLWLNEDGTADPSTNVESAEAAKALEIASSGNLEDGRYGFGDRRFVVKGDTLTIFDIDDEDISGKLSVFEVLKKNSNEMVHNGTNTSTIIEATKTLDAGIVVTLGGELGNCLASYSPATGEVIIPCLSVKGSNTVYRVKQHQISGTMTFEVGDGDVSLVQ